MTICGADNDSILEAVENTDFKDFEDALQDCCASTFTADYTITANIKDFENVSKIQALTPKEFLQLEV